MKHGHEPAGIAFLLSHLAACSLAWGSSFLFIKLIGADIAPLPLAALRGLTAMVALAAFIALRGGVPLPTRDEIMPWAIIGLFNGAIPNTLVAYAMQRMDSGPAVLIQSVGPLLTAIAGHYLFSDERLNGRSVFGILVGMSGVALLIGPDAITGRASLGATFAMLGVALCYSIGNLYTRVVRHHDAIRLSLGQQMFSCVFAGGAVLALGQTFTLETLQTHAISLLMLGIACTALPITIFMRMIVRAGPTRAALAGYTVPTVAVLIGILVLGEKPSLWHIAGGLTVLLGVFLVATSKRKPA